MKLAFKEIGKGDPVLILHGLFGSSDNWMSIAKLLEDHLHLYLLDMRNHGDSPHSDEFTYDAMADDIKEFIEEHDLDHPSIVGHSMGGKAAMKFAILHPDLFNKLVVVDIAPRYYPVHHTTILEGLKSIPVESLSSRSEADKKLGEYIKELGVRQFLLKNLDRKREGGFEWKINLPVIESQIENVGEGLDDHLSITKDVLFLRGSKSDYVEDGDIILINQLFPNAAVETVEGAGHWVHAEKPDEVATTLEKFLK